VCLSDLLHPGQKCDRVGVVAPVAPLAQACAGDAGHADAVLVVYALEAARRVLRDDEARETVVDHESILGGVPGEGSAGGVLQVDLDIAQLLEQTDLRRPGRLPLLEALNVVLDILVEIARAGSPGRPASVAGRGDSTSDPVVAHRPVHNHCQEGKKRVVVTNFCPFADGAGDSFRHTTPPLCFNAHFRENVLVAREVPLTGDIVYVAIDPSGTLAPINDWNALACTYVFETTILDFDIRGRAIVDTLKYKLNPTQPLPLGNGHRREPQVNLETYPEGNAIDVTDWFLTRRSPEVAVNTTMGASNRPAAETSSRNDRNSLNWSNNSNATGRNSGRNAPNVSSSTHQHTTRAAEFSTPNSSRLTHKHSENRDSDSDGGYASDINEERSKTIRIVPDALNELHDHRAVDGDSKFLEQNAENT
jgi:hypothetical protein